MVEKRSGHFHMRAQLEEVSVYLKLGPNPESNADL